MALFFSASRPFEILTQSLLIHIPFFVIADSPAFKLSVMFIALSIESDKKTLPKIEYIASGAFLTFSASVLDLSEFLLLFMSLKKVTWPDLRLGLTSIARCMLSILIPPK